MRKKRNSNIEWVLLGCAALFFGAGWSSFHIYMTQVFAIAGSEGLAPPYSLLSMSLGILPLRTALFCFYVGFGHTK
jgi:hypothetical protein